MKSGSAPKTKDFLGIDVNKGTHKRDSELILAQETFMDDDEELLARYRYSVNSLELGSSVASCPSQVFNHY